MQEAAQERGTTTSKKKSGSKGKKKTFQLLPTVEASSAQLPWKVAATQRLGRHAIAKVDLPAGTLILKEEPVAKVLLEASAPLCGNCLQPCQPTSAYTRLCASCQPKLEVSKELESLHALVEPISDRRDVDATLLHLIVKLACSPQEASADQLQGPGDPSAGTEGTVLCGIQDAELLQAHWDLQRPEWRKTVAAACAELEGVIKPDMRKCQRSLKELASIINSNSHGIGAALGETGMDTALGVFPALSMLNHSCRPNCNFISQGATMHVRTISPVKAGEELTVAYINLYDPRGTRRTQLQAGKFFACACLRCREPLADSADRFLEAVQCTACKGGLLVRQDTPQAGSNGHAHQAEHHDHGHSHAHASHEHAHGHQECGHDHHDHHDHHEHGHGHGHDHAHAQGHSHSAACSHGGCCGPSEDPTTPWQCLGCKLEVPGSTVDGRGPADAVQGVERQLVLGMQLARSKQWKGARQVLEGAVKLGEAALHPWHVLLFDARIPLVNCCRATDDSVAALQHCTKLIAAAEGLVGQLPSHELARWYTLLAELQLQRSQTARSGLKTHATKQAAEARAKAASIRRICIGLG